MGDRENLQPGLRRRAREILHGLPADQREALLIRCWTSHDARWFMAVAEECGMDVANRLNQVAAHELGKVEARRVAHALQLPPVKTLDGFLLFQETLIGLLGPELLDYEVSRVDDHAYRVNVQRCFAAENVVRAGIADRYECGIFPRVTGWLDGVDLDYELEPAPGRCLKIGGGQCAYTLSIDAASTARETAGAERE